MRTWYYRHTLPPLLPRRITPWQTDCDHETQDEYIVNAIQPTKHEIRLFGAFHALVDSQPLHELSAPRIQSLLAYLILHADAPQPRQRLAYLHWPDSTDSQARTNLRKALHHLRNSLPNADESVWITRTTVQWNVNAPYYIDVLHLNHLLRSLDEAGDALSDESLHKLVDAADIYSGDLLPECYDDWIISIRADYRQRTASLLKTLVTQFENRRDYDQAVHIARRLLDMDALNEGVARQLMRLCMLRNDRSQALGVYNQLCDDLRRELDVEPDAETQALFRRISERKEPSHGSKSSASVHVDTPVLVGRSSEWAALQSAWQSAAQGQAHLVVIAGEAGIGKTRLAGRIDAVDAAPGISCGSHTLLCGSRRPRLCANYRPSAQRNLCRKAHGYRRHLAQRTGASATRAAAERPNLPDPSPMIESWQRQRFFDALVNAVLADDSPLLLVFDDLQWCDQETLEWLSYLLVRQPNARLLVVGTVRSDEVDDEHPYSAMEMALTHSDQFRMLALSALGYEETHALADQVAGRALDEQRLGEVYRDTEGNPLFVVETIRAQDAETENHQLLGSSVRRRK